MATGEAQVPLLREQPHAHSESPRARAGPVEERHRSLGAAATVATALAAGAAAGALAKTTIAPLDRTKINFQISDTPYSWRAAYRWAIAAYRSEGLASLWRGNSATMARIVPYAAVQFAAHEQWKRALGVDDPAVAQHHPVRLLVAGSLAGVTSQSATYPLDVARARLAVAPAARFRSLRDVFARLVAAEGPRALYRGYLATVLGVIPYAGVSFFTYDTLKHKYKEHFGVSTGGGVVNVALGGAAGALGQTASYPLDIVRRRMQTDARRADGSYRYGTIRDTLRAIWRTEGWRGFFKGLSMNWLKGPAAVGISFATYDAIKLTLRDIVVSFQHR